MPNLFYLKIVKRFILHAVAATQKTQTTIAIFIALQKTSTILGVNQSV